MAKKSKAVVSEAPYKPKTMLYLESASGIKIPESLKGKLGKLVTLLVKAKVVSQRLSQAAGEKRRESYDLEIQKIKPQSKLGRILRS